MPGGLNLFIFIVKLNKVPHSILENQEGLTDLKRPFSWKTNIGLLKSEKMKMIISEKIGHYTFSVIKIRKIIDHVFYSDILAKNTD